MPYEQPVWAVKPVLGLYVGPLDPGYLTLGTGNPAVSVLFGLIGVVAAAFYLDHCTINQPGWAVLGGWGLLMSGVLALTLQEIAGPGRTTFIDIDHLLWPFQLAPTGIGAALIVASWWRAPEFFAPPMSRWTLPVMVAGMALAEVARRQGGVPQPLSLTLTALIIVVVVTAGEWVANRHDSLRAGGSELRAVHLSGPEPGRDIDPA